MTTIEYKGYKINIDIDEFAESPNKWGDDAQFIVYDHRSFYVEQKGFNPKEIFAKWSYDELQLYKGCYVFPLYAYIHSGVALSLDNDTYPFNDRWDVSMTGFALIKREKGVYRRNKAYQSALSLIKVWNQYLSNEVYYYNVEDPDGSDNIDSCHGYYGDYETSGLLDDAKGFIDSDIRKSEEINADQTENLNPVVVY